MCLLSRLCVRCRVQDVVLLVLIAVLFCAGEFGAVYKGQWKSGGKQIPIAIKTLKVRPHKLYSRFLVLYTM